MSLGNCIPGLVAAGKLTAKQGKAAQESYERHYRRFARDMGPVAAATEASATALKELAFKAKLAKRQTFLQVQAIRRARDDMARYDNGTGGKRGQAAIALLDHDMKAPYSNVALQKQAITGRAHALMEEVLGRFSRNLAGEMRDKATMGDVLVELFGKDSGNQAAKELAAAWTRASEYLRQRFNAAGGAIGRLDNWGLPQSHDPLSVREAGPAAWRDFVKPRLDRAKMIDDATGAPFDDAALDSFLGKVYETISTDGWATRKPGGAFGSKLASSRAEHRFLIFDGGQAWGEYHDAFGAGTSAYDAMIGHIDGMASDIAHMERLGPNPAATVRWLQDTIRKTAAVKGERAGLLGSPEGDAEALGRLYDLTSGKTGMPVNAKWARGLQGVRSVITAAKLGGAVFSAVSDTGFQMMTRGFNGLPITGALSDHLKLMSSAEHRRGAVRLGLIAEQAAQQATGLNRYVGESLAPGVAARLADAVLRVSGLSAWTQTGKWAYGMGELARATDLADRGFDALPDFYREHLARYGFDAAGWDAIRGGDRLNVAGADFLDPTAIKHQALGDRLLRMILTETSYAVPEVSARARTMMTFGRPGTLPGEISRSMMQFKSFGVSMILTHGRRAMSMSPYGAAGYSAGLFVTTTLLGALALQMKELAKGKDPRPMDDWHFWKDAALQAGGFGIFGDFIGNAFQQLEQQAGIGRAGGLGELVAGPLVSGVADAVKLGMSPFQKGKNDESYGRHVGREVVRDLKGYVPGSTLWQTRLLLERLVWDNLQRQIDPNHDRSWKMMEKHARERGQQFYWRPGETGPDRAPDLTNALEGAPQ
jgi:hypothetical protein